MALDTEENVVGGTDLGLQLRQAIRNLEAAVQAADGKLSDIVMIRLYIVHPKWDDVRLVGEVLREWFGTAMQPASSWIGVVSLARPDFLIEVEAIAVV